MAGVLNQEAGYVFIHVPKCAGMSITSSLTRSERSRQFGALPGLQEIVARENGVSSETVYVAGHARARDIRTWLGADAYEQLLSFAVVRNPWERLRSLYHFFQAQKDSPEYRVAHGQFDDFVVWYCEHRQNTMLERLTDRSGQAIVNRVLRFESLAADFAALSQDLGLNINTLPHRNASANLRESTPIPSGIVELVQQTYREDFRVFGYSPKPPMTVC